MICDPASTDLRMLRNGMNSDYPFDRHGIRFATYTNSCSLDAPTHLAVLISVISHPAAV